MKKVIGVEFLKDWATHATKAPARDVILTAGSFKTPHILELSGIGNKKILEKYGIESKIHLPGVGENLRTPILLTIDYGFRNQLTRFQRITLWFLQL